MISADQIMDELWRLTFWILKCVFLAIAWTANVVAMILYGLMQRLYFGTGWLRTYIQEWNPVRPEIFDLGGDRVNET